MANSNKEIGGFTDQELKQAFWLAAHKEQIIKIITFTLLLLSVVFWGITIFGLVKYFIIDGPKSAALEQSLKYDYVDYSYWREAHKPKDLSFSGVQIFSLGANRYDLVVKTVNDNPNWAVKKIKYKFNFSGRVVEEIKETFILPGETKYLIDLGVDSDIPASNVAFEVEEVKWQRVQDYSALKDRALNFEISNTNFAYAGELQIGGKANFSKTSFTFRNNTVYNFWEMGFYVVLHQGAGISGINYIVKNYIDAGSGYNIDVLWHQNTGRPDKVEVIPEVNILDPAVYRPIQGGTGEVK